MQDERFNRAFDLSHLLLAPQSLFVFLTTQQRSFTARIVVSGRADTLYITTVGGLRPVGAKHGFVAT